MRVSGEVDLSNAPVFGKYLSALIDDERQDLELDLQGIGFMDSSGVAVLLDVREQLLELGSSLLLVSPSSAVVRVLSVSGVYGAFEISDSTDAVPLGVPALAEPA